MKKLLLLVVFLAGCDHKPVTDEEVKQHVNYFQDKRTGLCYALMDSGFHGTGISVVPCEKVQQLLDNPWSH